MKETVIDKNRLDELKKHFAPGEKVKHIERCSTKVFADKAFEFVFLFIMLLIALSFIPIALSASGALKAVSVFLIIFSALCIVVIVALFVLNVVNGLKPRYLVFTDESLYLAAEHGAEAIHYGNIDKRIKVGANAIYIESEIGSGMEYNKRLHMIELISVALHSKKRRTPYRLSHVGDSVKSKNGGYTVTQMKMDPAYSSNRYDPDIQFLFKRYPIDNGIALATELMKIEKENKKRGKVFPLLVVPAEMQIDDEPKYKW